MPFIHTAALAALQTAMPPKKADEGEQKGAARFGRVKNNLKMGLLGLPNVGKSSLFNLLTEQVGLNRQPAPPAHWASSCKHSNCSKWQPKWLAASLTLCTSCLHCRALLQRTTLSA